MDTTKALTIGLTSVLSGILGLGTYGALRDREWSSWTAGALVGALGGGLSLLALSQMPGSQIAGIFTSQVGAMPGRWGPRGGMTLSGLTAQRLRGLQAERLRGLTAERIGRCGTCR